ncbi:LysR substrate binding domain protein [Gleimia coleocanis DSM 15436]|uniref:Probable hydrogen peroxide-inducible genes activator n=1 Tax=Gleimia coleocanis DSM 15436 TaxID=525245 RepID=C0VZJ2_9ACTO|nr:LysR substrate-binding domain-containing protein [Gleimia coleocanis]EEH64111.1 LysR substrate binding domain protein [Gleimia coleocanis DSM 15436]
MNIRDLRYFTVLVDERSFTKAAARCGVSQPTLSTQIRKLEEKIGATLVERASQGIIITPVGQEILEYARSIIDKAEAIQNYADRAKDPHSGTFTLGMFPTLGPYLLPHIMHRIQKELPNITVRLVEEKSEILSEMLSRGELDGIVLGEEPHDERLIVKHLFDEEFVFASTADHPLANLDRPLTVEDLNGTELLLLTEGHCLRQQSLEICHTAQAKQVDFRASSFPALRYMVASGIGASLFPRFSVIPPIMNPETLKITEFAQPRPSRHIYFAMRASSPLITIGEDLQRIIMDVAPMAKKED